MAVITIPRAEPGLKRLTTRKTDWSGLVFRALLLAALGVALLILVVLLVDVFVDGRAFFGSRLGDFLTGTLRQIPTDPLLGVQQGLYGSLWVAIIVAVLAFPLGIGASLYLEEYARKGRLASMIELTIRNLAGVPSVVFGLLGLFLFVDKLESVTGGRTVLAAGFTMAVLVLPIVIITSQEAVRSVPSGLKEGAYGAGATKWDVIRTQILPYAAPGILTGTLLSMARAVGEAAPLILVGAVGASMSENPSMLDIGAIRDRFTAMPIVITSWVKRPEPEFAEAAAAAIVVLLVFVMLLNMTAILLRNRFEKRRG